MPEGKEDFGVPMPLAPDVCATVLEALNKDFQFSQKTEVPI